MDIGWNRTAVIWGAEDPGSGAIELYDEHYMGRGEPPSHVAAIKARGEWMNGVIDPASLGSSQLDGRVAIDEYRNLGLHLEPALNAIDTGIQAVWTLTSVLGALDVVDDGSAQLVSTVLEVTAVFATCTALAATLPSPEERRSARRLGWWGLALGLTSPVLAALAATDELGIVVLAGLPALVAAIVVLVRTLLLVRRSAAQPPPAETALSPLPG